MNPLTLDRKGATPRPESALIANALAAHVVIVSGALDENTASPLLGNGNVLGFFTLYIT